jgi:hypothetical protein
LQHIILVNLPENESKIVPCTTADTKMTFVNMTMRCGSTLLSQMVNNVAGVRVISESWAFVSLHGLYITDRITLSEYRQLLKSTVRLQMKRESKVYLATGTAVQIAAQ